MTEGARCLGRLQLAGFELTPAHGPPRLGRVPRGVASELRHLAGTGAGLRELSDFLGLPGIADRVTVVERVSGEIEAGRLMCTPRGHAGVVASFEAPEPEVTNLVALANLEPRVVEYAVELRLIDQDDAPVAGVAYVMTLPDGSTREGVLDAQGGARVSGLTSPEPCAIRFPGLDGDAWSYVHARPL